MNEQRHKAFEFAYEEAAKNEIIIIFSYNNCFNILLIFYTLNLEKYV